MEHWETFMEDIGQRIMYNCRKCALVLFKLTLLSYIIKIPN
jgi:hypothetical protein